MRTLRLIEALPKSEGVSEVAVLDAALSVMAKGADQRIARRVRILPAYPSTKAEFLTAIQRPCDYLHISAHGKEDKRGGCLFVRGGGLITPEDLDGGEIHAKTVFVNACDALSNDLVQAFIDNSVYKPTHYIAPDGDTWFDDALLVALLFWKSVLFDGKRPRIALRCQEQLKGLRARYLCDAW